MVMEEEVMSEAVMFIGGPEGTRRLDAREAQLLPMSLLNIAYMCG